jgi:hypothetical protein
MTIKDVRVAEHLAQAIHKFNDMIAPPPVLRSLAITTLLRQVRQDFPNRRIQDGVRGLTIFGSGDAGFPVSVEEVGRYFIVYVGPGIVEVATMEEARALIRKACSSAARLEIIKQGRKVKSWRLVDTVCGRPLASGGFCFISGFCQQRSMILLQNGTC